MATTVEEVTAVELEEQAKKYLTNTDWMINKNSEDAAYSIPAIIIEKRAFARTLIDTTVHKAIIASDINPIFYDESDHLLSFKNLVVHNTPAPTE